METNMSNDTFDFDDFLKIFSVLIAQQATKTDSIIRAVIAPLEEINYGKCE
jgi:hypothetical protein